MTHAHAYLGGSEVDLHDESHRHPQGEGEARRDDDGEPVALAGAVLREGVRAGLPQRGDLVAGQVRRRGREALQAGRLQEHIGV